MRTFICIYFLIGLVTTLIITGKETIEDIKSGKYSVITSVVGTVLLSVVAPIGIVWGIIKWIEANLSNLSNLSNK